MFYDPVEIQDRVIPKLSQAREISKQLKRSGLEWRKLLDGQIVNPGGRGKIELPGKIGSQESYSRIEDMINDVNDVFDRITDLLNDIKRQDYIPFQNAVNRVNSVLRNVAERQDRFESKIFELERILHESLDEMQGAEEFKGFAYELNGILSIVENIDSAIVPTMEQEELKRRAQEYEDDVRREAEELQKAEEEEQRRILQEQKSREVGAMRLGELAKKFNLPMKEIMEILDYDFNFEDYRSPQFVTISPLQVKKVLEAMGAHGEYQIYNRTKKGIAMLHRKNRGRDWQKQQFGRRTFQELVSAEDKLEEAGIYLTNELAMKLLQSKGYDIINVNYVDTSGVTIQINAREQSRDGSEVFTFELTPQEVIGLAGQFSKRGRNPRQFKRASFRRRIFQSTQEILSDLNANPSRGKWQAIMADLSALIQFAGNGVLKQIFSAMDKILYENPGFDVPRDVQDKRVELGFNAMRPGRTGLRGAVSQIGKGALRVTDDIANDMFLVPGWRRGEKRPVYGRNRRSRRNRGRW